MFSSSAVHLQIPLKEILSATNNFSEANLLRRDGFRKEYKGQLVLSGKLINIVARRLDGTYEQGTKEFWMEVNLLSALKHENLVSIVGFCDEKGEKIVIHKHEPRGSLYIYLRDSTLTWMRRLEICVGVARALNCIYYEERRHFSVIHTDIKSSNILLDDNWEAKLSGFEYSMRHDADVRGTPFFRYVNCGTPGYVDPIFSRTGSVTDKSDVYSLGVVLFEVLCWKEAAMMVNEEEYTYLAPLARSHYQEGRLNDLIDPQLLKQMDPQSLKVFSETAYCCLNEQRYERPKIDQILIQLEEALESQRKYENPFGHLQIPLEEIVSATNNFSNANIIRVDGFGKEYKGQLLRSGQLINIVARRLNGRYAIGNKHFWMEVSMLSTLKHENITSIVGFCYENGEKIVINMHESHGSLDQYLSDMSLTWMRRLHICVGVARALSYIYYDEGRDSSVIHRDIKSPKILLDDQWEAKLSGFELSLNRTAAERDLPCLIHACGTIGYCDPTYLNEGSVSQKSDIFSLGVVLFEVLCGKEVIVEEEDNMYFSQLAKSHYERGRLDDLVDPGLHKQMDPQSFTIFSEIAYYCLNEQPSHRPDIDQIVIELEKALESQRNHEHREWIQSTNATADETSPANLKFAHLQIPVEEIASATNDFSDENLIRRGGFGNIYKGQLLRSGQLIDIVARRLDTTYMQGKKEFLMEVSLLSTLKHENVVSMLGFCAQGNEKIIVNKHATNGSLDKYLRDPNLSWMQRLEICVGVARALSYIHYDNGRNFSVIHRNIKSSKILLDDNWKPKLCGFELSMKNATTRRHRLLLDRLSGTIGYIDPKYEKTGGVTHKSDVYSFGVVLFEVMCGRRAFNHPEWFSAQLAKQEWPEESSEVEGKLDEIIDHDEGRSPQLAKQRSCDIDQDDVSIIQQKDPSSSSTSSGFFDTRIWMNSSNNISKPMEAQSNRNLSAGMQVDLSSLNFSVVSRTTSVHSLVYGSSGNSSEQGSHQSFSGVIRAPAASSTAIDREEESNVHIQQHPALNPVDMCMFTLAPSARFYFEERLGHLCIPEEELLAPLAISHYEDKKLYELIDPDLWKQMDPQSFNVFSKTAYDCLKEQRSERPDIDQIVIRLQEALDLQWKHEYPALGEHSQVAEEVEEATSSNRLKWRKLKHLKIEFHEIEFATQNFSQTQCIGSGGYGKVYKAELEHFDSKNPMEIEGKNVYDLPKIRSNVAIKCLFKRNDTQAEEGFSAEIETLTSCKHPNIVSLLGFCDEEDSDLILVYEYVSNGSLDDFLRSIDKMATFKWERRLQMCLHIAEGLNYLHNHTPKSIIHRDIKSDNILLDDKWVAKIADFGLSKIGPMSQQASHIETHVAGTIVYLDPEYEKTRRLKKASDIYSLGVVLFEILTGRLAYHQAYMKENEKGLAPFVRQHFHKGTLKDLLDPKLKEEFDENIFTLSKGPNQDSLDTFLDIAYQCLAETQAQRPNIGTVVEKLKNALQLQKTHKDKLQISLEDIKMATRTFSDNNRIGRGGFGRVYKGEVTNVNGRHTTIAAKRLDTTNGQGETEFLTELEILLEYKHENVIGLLGYCNERGEKIIVYEYASRGSLDRHLSNNDLTWRKRLEICIDIANGLQFLHGGGVTQEVVMHRDIKSPNILLTDDWKAKISDFGLSSITSVNEDMSFVIDNACGTKGYCDPSYLKLGVFRKESDIYSFGVLLFEILCGRLMFEDIDGHIKPLIDSVKRRCEQGKIDEMVFKGIKEQIAPKSFTIFRTLDNECVHDLQRKRPTTNDVILRLKQALEFQEDYEIWAPKLANGYEEIFKMSSISKTYFTKTKKDLHDMLSKGILLQKGKVLLSLCANGERNEMISARKFLYKHRRLHKWSSVPESRFHKVAKILDISNLKIQMKIKAEFLSPGVYYGVHLVFKFSGPRKYVAKQMYVNLKYKMGSETLHSYFAKLRDDGWMSIGLCQFWNYKKDASLEFLLESFSRCYCGSRHLYVAGIEFQAIDNVEYEELSKNIKEVQVQKTNSNMEQVDQLLTYFEEAPWKVGYSGKHEENLNRYKVNKKKSYMVSAKDALHISSDDDHVKLSAQSRSQYVIELQRQQVFRIKCKIESQRLSPDTEYACYIVFKLSEKCRGLHCPVIVRDLLQRKNKEKGLLYFRSPTPLNANDTDRVPAEREDGLMEVKLWQFNSSSGLRNDCVSINLKLISYEGTMSGLVISNLEFRPI